MYFLLITVLGVASFSMLPAKMVGTTEVHETPQALPLVAQTQPTAGVVRGDITSKSTSSSISNFNGGGEIWQEDDREVLIRNERGTKQNTGGIGGGSNGGAGKRGKNKKNNRNIVDSMKLKEMHVQTSELALHLQQQQNKQMQQYQELKKLEQQKQKNKQQTHVKHSSKQNLKSGDEQSKLLPSSCRYIKSPWTECDPKSNMRMRTLTLKKGDGCDPTRIIEKKCKKACRYEKGTWSECTGGQITRTDKLKSTSDSTCLATRVINKNCNNGKSKDKSNKDRKDKDKGTRKGRA